MNSTIYTKIEGIECEQIFSDVDSMENGYKEIPISFDTILFGTVLEKDNFFIHSNSESSSGCFYAPFIKCENQEQIKKTIAKIVARLSKELKASIPDIESQFIRVFVYRFVTTEGIRFFAFGAVNGKPKHPIFHTLKIKTNSIDPEPIVPEDSWAAVIEETLANPKETNLCIIEKNEIIEFEPRRAPVPNISKNVLVMVPQDDGFNARHYSNPTKNSYQGNLINNGDVPPGSFFELRTIHLASMKDLDRSIKWMVETYRAITGLSKVKAMSLYSITNSGSINASIICYMPFVEKDPPSTEVLL